ncbi:MAG: efflux RND transporter periplasmic adaptor subunit [Terrimicrobiaceae bacterium]|nr:efflux RND transporter periplasmic adaptor subunit [Terrimicrobiaceae bacterium]
MKLLWAGAWLMGLAQVGAAEPVVVAEARETEFVDRIEALGTLRANESVNLAANVTKRVVKIGFEDGQRVKKGDVLVEMLSAEEEALIGEAEATAREAQLQYERSQQLTKSGASAKATLDEARRINETARARLVAIESRLADLRIVAPFDGVVGLRNISVGAMVQPGDLITTLDDDRVMKLDFTVPTTFLRAMEPGVPIQAKARAFGDEVFEGEVTSVGTRVDPVTRSVTVRAVIPNPEQRLKPGLLMTVDILSNKRRAIVVPEEAVIGEGTTQQVFVVDGETAKRREVVLGARQTGEVEVVEGLKAGEKVVTRGAMSLSDGAAVKVRATDDGRRPLAELITGGAES